MSWDQQTYSFGNPNAQPPTPTQTPTSAAFPSPSFQTPRPQPQAFDNRSGWTPTFAEEYSVFNATPGRLTSNSGTFADISTPRPSTAASHKRTLSTADDLEAELASHVHHIVQTSLPLPPVDPTRQLTSSPTVALPAHNRSDISQRRTTPRKPRRRLEEAFSGQTATPPPSATKGSRKLAPKSATMQGDQEPYPASSGTPGQQNVLHFSTNPDDLFTYPMSAPATAPVFTNAKPFWDPDSNMSDMDMNFTVNDDAMFDPVNSHRMNDSFDWSRSNQIFQDSGNVPFSPAMLQSSRRQRLVDPGRLPGETQDFNVSLSEDPFAIVASTGAVDPGLLFSFPDIPPPDNNNNNRASTFDMQPMSQDRPPKAQLISEPYQHQLRESRRDQEEVRRSRSSRENSAGARFNRVSRSSPVKMSDRQGLQRGVSDSRPRRLAAQKTAPRQTASELNTPSNKRRSSPLKHQNRTSLTSIPESVPGTRTSVTFTIDANGRARTETRIIVDEPRTAKGGPAVSNATSEDWNSNSPSGSSSDDEPIILPSRNNSFKLPLQKGEGPKLSRFETSRPSMEYRRRSISDAGTLSRNSGDALDDLDSDAETIHDPSGDAAFALRKVMETKKTYPSNGPQRSSSQITPRNRQNFGQHNSSNISPTTLSDPDLDTPSTDHESTRSESTRCVCNSRDGDSFMIQCESCEKWLHAKCVNIRSDRLPNVYICPYCAQTPNMRGGRIREPARGAALLGSSPLAHKSFKSWR